jgi:hypothetical protein
MTNTVIILNNESGIHKGGAPLGQHATLAYICAAIAMGKEVLLFDESRHSVESCLLAGSFPMTRLNENNFGEYVKIYKEQNTALAKLTQAEGAKVLASNHEYTYDENHLVAGRKIVRVRDIATANSGKNPAEFTMNDISPEEPITIAQMQEALLINRLDPMLESFHSEDKAAAGDENVFQFVLKKLKETFPQTTFSDPSGKCDKIGPEEADAARAAEGKSAIYTPTWKAKINNFDTHFSAGFKAALEEEGKFYPREKAQFANQPQRVVFKPIDSAQSSGVCGIEFSDEGLNLAELREFPIMKLIAEDLQLLRVRPDCKDEEIKEMAKILLYAQALKEKFPEESKGKKAQPENLKELKDVTSDEMAAITKTLYETDILIQPFMIGVAKMGDVRVNITADKDGIWSSVGHTFRAQIAAKKQEGATTNDHSGLVAHNGRDVGSRFTTCFSAGKASPTRAEYTLSEAECESLKDCVEGLLWALNGPMKSSYKDCQELGVDFVPVGDGLSFCLGEMNHVDPALAPVSAALRKGLFDLATDLRSKENTTDAEKKLLESYGKIYTTEAEFAKTYDGGIGCMETSIKNAQARQEERLEKRGAETSSLPDTKRPKNSPEPNPHAFNLASGMEHDSQSCTGR